LVDKEKEAEERHFQKGKKIPQRALGIARDEVSRVQEIIGPVGPSGRGEVKSVKE